LFLLSFVLWQLLFTIDSLRTIREKVRTPRLGAKQNLKQSNHNSDGRDTARVYWRVEGSLLELTTVRPIAFFTWNGQTFIGRWMRRGSVLFMALLRPFLYAANRVFATRVVHTVLRGVSRDRLDLLGEEYFLYKLKPQLKPDGVQGLKELIDSGAEVVLISQGLDHVMAPLARHLGAKWVIANRLEFRDGMATGRLLDPVVRPRGVFARITGAGPDGTRAPEQLVRDLGLSSGPQGVEELKAAVTPAERRVPVLERPIVHFDDARQSRPLSVRRALAGKSIMLIGVTGFIGKVWLVNLLMAVFICSFDGRSPIRHWVDLKRWWKTRPSLILCTNVTALG
jgi:hypothetical protein